MRALVTGGTGFIGSHLVRQLLRQGAEVHLLIRESSNRWRIRDLEESPILVCHLADLRCPSEVEALCREISPEVVYHLATYGANPSDRDSLEAFAVNVQGTVSLIRALAHTSLRCRGLVYTTSWYEYGGRIGEVREMDALQPIGIHAEMKTATRLVAQALSRQYQLPFLAVRLFGIYGPYDRPHRFVPFVILSLLRGESPRLGSCEQIRDYIYVEDVAEGLLRCAEVELHPNKPLVLNLGSGQPVPLRKIVEEIQRILRLGALVQYGVVPHRENEDVSSVWPDVSRARDMLAWEPPTSLAEGVRKTVEWFRQHQYLYPDGRSD